MSSQKKILIIQTAFIGDAILATAFVESTKASFPNAHIDFMLRKGNEGILQQNKKIAETLIWDKKRKWSSLFSLLKTVRKRKYDLLFLLQRFNTMALFALLSKARVKIGFSSSPLSYFFTNRVPHEISKSGTEHEVQRNLKLLKVVTYEAKLAKPYINIEEISLTDVKKNYITIAPASVWATKQYPAEKWVEFIKKIPATTTIYLLGAGADNDKLELIRNSCLEHDIINLAGKLNLRESAFLMKSANMNFVNDSAPLHLCSAVNAPVTAVFCSTVPEFGFGPLSEDGVVIQAEIELDCRPCGIHGHNSCPRSHFKCAHEISVMKLVQRL